jgi:maleylpyruvate isomerase
MQVGEMILQLDQATARLVRSVAGLPLDEVGRPSNLPSWSRGHVLTHLARQADGLRNYLLGARIGRTIRMYASITARDVDIEFGAMRPAQNVADDVIKSSTDFVTDAQAMPAEIWRRMAVHARRSDDGPLIPVAAILQTRLAEVEIHHVDLNWDYSFEDSPPDVLDVLISRYMGRLADDGQVFTCRASDLGTSWSAGDVTDAPVISGPAHALIAWLTRRSEGLELASNPVADLPVLPPM